MAANQYEIVDRPKSRRGRATKWKSLVPELKQLPQEKCLKVSCDNPRKAQFSAIASLGRHVGKGVAHVYCGDGCLLIWLDSQKAAAGPEAAR